jgi:riboflavin transporter FmnP
MKNKKLNIIVKISILSAMALILSLIEFPLPIFPDFLKLDISDVPAILGAFAMGPVAGVMIELVKNILHFIFKNSSYGIGELANFIVGASYVYVSGIIYKTGKSRKTALIGLIAATITMGIVASIGNYLVFLPLYEKVLNFPIVAVVGLAKKINPSVVNLNTLIAYSILPFNIIKGAMLSIIVFLVYKRVSPILHR